MDETFFYNIITKITTLITDIIIIFSRGQEISGWCPMGSVLSYAEKEPLNAWLQVLREIVSR